MIYDDIATIRIKELEKQSDLLTLGLLQEKFEVARLKNLMLLADKDLHSATFEKMPKLVKRCIMDARRRLKA